MFCSCDRSAQSVCSVLLHHQLSVASVAKEAHGDVSIQQKAIENMYQGRPGAAGAEQTADASQAA